MEDLIIESIICGQRKQAVTQMQREAIDFKALYSRMVEVLGLERAGEELAIIADMTAEKWG